MIFLRRRCLVGKPGLPLANVRPHRWWVRCCPERQGLRLFSPLPHAEAQLPSREGGARLPLWGQGRAVPEPAGDGTPRQACSGPRLAHGGLSLLSQKKFYSNCSKVLKSFGGISPRSYDLIRHKGRTPQPPSPAGWRVLSGLRESQGSKMALKRWLTS